MIAGCEPVADTSTYRVTRYVGEKPVERWVCDEIGHNRSDGSTYIYYKGRILEIGLNVRVEKLEDYAQEEKYEDLIK